MVDPKYQCSPCKPFTTMDKCAYCLKIRLRAVEHARTMKTVGYEYDRDTPVDVVSEFPDLDAVPDLDAAAEQELAA